MARFAEKYMIAGNNSSLSVGSNEPDVQTDSSAFVAAVTKIYPEKGLAQIDSAFMGKDAVVPYYPECGIREGGAVLVSVGSNVPRITHALDFGCENTALLDPAGENKGEFFKEIHAEGIGNVAEKANGFASSIAHKDGEKVFACDFSGLKAGITHSVLFYEANARVVVSDGIVATYADNIVLFSSAGTIVIDEPENGEDMGVKTESIFKIEGSDGEKKGLEVFKEYKGNVKAGLSSDEITITSFPGSNISLADLIYLMLVIDDDISSYKQSVSEVTHTYIDRKLEVEGGGGDGVLLNADFAGKQGLGLIEDDLQYRAIIATRGSNEVALTYVKAITRKGDVYEFSAGESCSVTNEHKTIATKKREDFMMADYTKSYQKNHREIQYPVSKESVVHTENFGNNISEIKGDANHVFYRYSTFRKINTRTIYDVDKPSNIQTNEHKVSPVIYIDTNNIHTSVKEHDDIDKPVKMTDTLTKDAATMSFDRDVTSAVGIVVQSSEGTKKSFLKFGNSGFSAITEGRGTFKTKTFFIDSEKTAMKGMLSLADGLSVKGDFYIQAENIHLSAKSQFSIAAKNIWMHAEGAAGITYKDYFIVTSNYEGVDSGGDPKQASMLWMNNFEVFVQAEKTQLYGNKFLYAFTPGYGVFGGSEDAVFFGEK